MTDDRDQMEVATSSDGGDHLFMRMRCSFNKMTTFDDVLTTNDDLGGLRCRGGTDFRNGFCFISTGYRSLRRRNV